MIIASFNVNSIRQRIEHLTRWLKAKQPDIVCLQELKCVEEVFPREEIELLGYNIAINSQKGFNGVAILSKFPIDIEQKGLPNFEDEQARYIEVLASLPNDVIRVACIYFPNGNPTPGTKFDYKLQFLEAFEKHCTELLKLEEKTIFAGDYNIIPEEKDAKHPEIWKNDALFLPQSRAAFRRILNLGLTDAIRATTQDGGIYSFWDYQAGSWQKNNGIRIDHLLLSPQLADILINAGIDKEMRAEEKPSDHVPVWCDIKI